MDSRTIFMKPEISKIPSVKIDNALLSLLEKLSNAAGVSGCEDEVRRIVIDAIKPHADEYRVDAIGNVLAVKHSDDPNALRVMFAAHMDEVGLMLVEDEGDGIYAFERVGGIDERQLASKPVVVGKNHLPGVIGSKPIHLEDQHGYNQVISKNSMRIDVSPANSGKLEIGDYAAFATRFQRSGSSLFGKALDDRLGVASLIELIKDTPRNLETLFAFTVQEEIGRRGAAVAAYDFKPEMAFIVDATPSMDMPDWDRAENTRYNSRLGCGPAIYLSDAGTIYDPRMIRFVLTLAEEHHIPHQFRQPGPGYTDAAGIHINRVGVPSLSISIPIRYPHSPISHAKIEDWENTLTLLKLVLSNVDRAILALDR
jgi:endoglucanase